MAITNGLSFLPVSCDETTSLQWGAQTFNLGETKLTDILR